MISQEALLPHAEGVKSAIVVTGAPGEAVSIVYQHHTEEKKLLIVAAEEDCHSLYRRLLDRNGVVPSRVDTGKQCLEAAAQESFSLILIRIPLADLSVSAMTTGLTQRFSLNANTPLLLLAEGGQYEAALGYSSPRIQVIDVKARTTNLERLITAALGIALRTATRLDVEMEVETGESHDRRRCRTRDISSSGMLLESSPVLPVGTEFAFNFTLPERFTPIHGRGQVVRHATEREIFSSGMGIKFIDFPEGAEEAIQAFVQQNTAYPH